MVKKLLLLLLAVLTSATGVWAQAYNNEPVRTWDLRQWNEVSVNYVSSQGMTLSDYDNKSSIHSTYGLHLRGQSLSFQVSQGQIVSLTITNNSDTYRAKAKMTLGGTEVAFQTAIGQGQSETAYLTADENGNVTISGNGSTSNTFITSISIENAPTVAFSSDQCVAELIDLNVAEPTLSYPSPSTVSYSVSNPKIANTGGESNSGDIMCVNTGVTGVTATVNYKGNTYTASYTLTIKADDATYSVVGNTYTLTGPGKLQERVVNLVPKITMEFGSTEVVNTTIVRDEANAPIVGTTIDQNGWRQLWFNSTDGLVHPYQGTYYTFKPKTNGKLTVTGYLSNPNQNAYIVKESNLAPVSKRMTSQVFLTPAAWNSALDPAGTNVAPAVTTDDGRTAQMVEDYQTNVNATGEILYQELNNIANGTYVVTLYANAMFTSGRGFDSDMADGATDVAYVFANDEKTPITAKIGGSTTVNGEYTISVNVTNNTLRLGIGKWKAGTNWHTIQIKSLLRETGTSSYPFTPVSTITTSSASQLLTTEVGVEGGETYYLYGNIPSSNGVL